MYDTPHYNQLKIIGIYIYIYNKCIYTINIYKMITNTHSFNFHEGQNEQILTVDRHNLRGKEL